MMIKKVTLSTGKVFDPKSVMPVTKNKVGLFYSGGIISSLIALMMIKKYGADNIIFILLSIDAYTNPASAAKTREDFNRRVEAIGGQHTIELTNEDANNCDEYYGTRKVIDIALKKIRNSFGECKHIFSGYSLVHKESMQALNDAGWDKTIHLRSEISEWFEENKNDYPEVKQYIYDCGGQLYFTTSYMPFTDIKDHFNRSVKPFVELSKSEIIELYYKFKLDNELFKTISCNKLDVESNQQCGVCKNCKQRKMAFQTAGIEDLTSYVN